MPEVTGKLSADSNYKKMFRAAFGDDNITGERVLKALSQFMATMISADSKYDQYRKGQVFYAGRIKRFLIISAEMCFLVTQENCLRMKATEIQECIIMLSSMIKEDRVTLNIADYMKFRVPVLRNIEYTAPYMHDGRFYSLEAVLNFYSDNEDQPNLDPFAKTKRTRRHSHDKC
jgi:cytochrome c peroxidase